MIFNHQAIQQNSVYQLLSAILCPSSVVQCTILQGYIATNMLQLQRKGTGLLPGSENSHALLLSNIHDIPGPVSVLNVLAPSLLFHCFLSFLCLSLQHSYQHPNHPLCKLSVNSVVFHHLASWCSSAEVVNFHDFRKAAGSHSTKLLSITLSQK